VQSKIGENAQPPRRLIIAALRVHREDGAIAAAAQPVDAHNQHLHYIKLD
jgi:hypothetical protein